MTNNNQYPTPTPTRAVLTTAANAFETAVHEALDGGRIVIATRNAARVELLALLRQMAAYVQASCNADLLALLSSGFEAVRAPSRVGLLPPPTNPRLSLTGKSGELMFRFEREPCKGGTIEPHTPRSPFQGGSSARSRCGTFSEKNFDQIPRTRNSAHRSGWRLPSVAEGKPITPRIKEETCR